MKSTSMESAPVLTEMFYSVLTYGAFFVDNVSMREIVATSLTRVSTHLWVEITIANLPL